MKQLLFTLAALFLMALGLQAQGVTQEQPVQSTSSVQENLEKALLWRVEGDSASGPSYLFGTIHIIDTDDFFLPVGTESAIEQSDRIVFEIDLADMMDLGAQLSIFTKAFMKGGIKLSDLVSEEDYALVKTHFEEMGLPLFMLERIKPMFLSVFAGGDFSMEDLQGGGGTTSYEMEFYQKTQALEIPSGGLETMEFQLAVFDSIPYEDQARMLVESIKFDDDSSEQFDEMMRLYLDQDVDGLHQITTASEEDLGGYEDLLLDNRNANWIAPMEEYMSAGRTFFAVGAAHLGGPNGVIRLLRAEGYSVTPVLSEIEARPIKRF